MAAIVLQAGHYLIWIVASIRIDTVRTHSTILYLCPPQQHDGVLLKLLRNTEQVH